MANLFFNLPTTPGDGSGAPVDTSDAGREKTITVQGAYAGTVNVETSCDGGATWSQVATFSGGATGKRTLEFAAQLMRVTRSGVPLIAPGQPNVDVGTNDNGQRFVTLPVPAGDGLGAPINVSALGTFNTVTVQGGSFTGSVNVLISDDGVDYTTCMTFQTPGIRSKVFTAQFMRVERSGVDLFAPGLPQVAVGAVNDAASGSSSSAYGPIVYQPGGPAPGPGVVTTWAEVIARIAAIRSAQGGAVPIELQFDDSFGAIVFDAGVHDMKNVTWTVFPDVDGSAFFDILIPEGVQFTNLRSFGKLGSAAGVARLESTATVTSPISDFSNGTVLQSVGWQFQASGGVPLFSLASLAPGDLASFVLQEGGTGFGGTNEAIDLPVAGTFLVLAIGQNAGLQANTISSAAGATIIYQVSDDSSFSFNPQVNNLAAPVYQMGARDWMIVTPVPPAPPSLGAIANPANGEYRYRILGGTIAQTLAPANSGMFPGAKVVFKETTGQGAITLTPAGADTIDEGRVTSVRVPPGGSVTLVTNGIDNWDIVGATNDQGSVLVWGAASIGATADTRYLPPGTINTPAATTAIYGFLAPRAGVLRNFAAVHNSANGNGNSAVYDVVINGVPQGLGLALATGAAGTATNTAAFFSVPAQARIDVTVTKAIAINNGSVDVTFSAELV